MPYAVNFKCYRLDENDNKVLVQCTQDFSSFRKAHAFEKELFNLSDSKNKFDESQGLDDNIILQSIDIAKRYVEDGYIASVDGIITL